LNSDTPSCDNLHGRRLGLCDFRERRCSETLAALSSAPQLAGQHDTRYHSHSRREQRRLQHHSAPGHACETRRRCARPARSPVLQQAGTWAGGRHAPKPLLPAAECVRRIPRPPALRSPAEPPRATTVGSACCQGEAHSPCAQGAGRGGAELHAWRESEKRKTNCDMLVREGVPLARTCTRPRAAGFRPQSFRLGPSASSRGGWRQGIGRKWGRAGVARRNERRVTEGVETIARPEHTLAVAPVGNLGAQRASGPGGAPPAPGTSASASACSCATSLTPLPFRPVRGRQPAHALEVARLHGALAGRVWQQRKWHAHLPQRPDGKMPQ